MSLLTRILRPLIRRVAHEVEREIRDRVVAAVEDTIDKRRAPATPIIDGGSGIWPGAVRREMGTVDRRNKEGA